jgi:hypothetical protein
MDYKKIHDTLIEKAKLRQLGKNKLLLKEEIGYIEEHHIIPEFFYVNRKRKGPPGWLEGDPDIKENLVFLTAKEHLLCHLLLMKIYPNIDGLITACQNMAGVENKKLSIRLFKKMRERYAQIVSDRFSDVPKSQEHKDNLSKSLKGRPVPHQQGDKNVSKRPEVAKKISVSKKGVSTGPCSEETKKRISKANKGHKGLIGDNNPGTWRLCCIRCKKETTLPALTKWHKSCKMLHT